MNIGQLIGAFIICHSHGAPSSRGRIASTARYSLRPAYPEKAYLPEIDRSHSAIHTVSFPSLQAAGGTFAIRGLALPRPRSPKDAPPGRRARAPWWEIRPVNGLRRSRKAPRAFLFPPPAAARRSRLIEDVLPNPGVHPSTRDAASCIRPSHKLGPIDKLFDYPSR